MVRMTADAFERAASGGSAGITAPANAVLKFDKPAIQTYSPATGYSPVAGTNSSYSNMAPVGSQSVYQPPQQGVTGGTWAQPPAAPVGPPAPPAPPPPPTGGRTWFNGLDAAGQAAERQSWLGGDSDYTSQIGEYDKALQTFVDRIANQKKMFTQDADDAVASTVRNQGTSLNQLGEDFGARGLSFSGMFDTARNQTNERFNEAKGGIEKVKSRNLADASNREADYRTENQISRGNAEKSSLNRQAQRQALLDSMSGF